MSEDMSERVSKKRKVTFDPNGRSSSGTVIPLDKSKRNYDNSIKPTQVTWNGEKVDDWVSTNKKNFQTPEEFDAARKSAMLEKNFLGGEWSIKNINDDGTASLCNLATGACILIAILTAGEMFARSSGFGGKTRSKKRKGRKTRRRHK